MPPENFSVVAKFDLYVLAFREPNARRTFRTPQQRLQGFIITFIHGAPTPNESISNETSGQDIVLPARIKGKTRPRVRRGLVGRFLAHGLQICSLVST